MCILCVSLLRVFVLLLLNKLFLVVAFSLIGLDRVLHHPTPLQDVSRGSPSFWLCLTGVKLSPVGSTTVQHWGVRGRSVSANHGGRPSTRSFSPGRYAQMYPLLHRSMPPIQAWRQPPCILYRPPGSFHPSQRLFFITQARSEAWRKEISETNPFYLRATGWREVVCMRD